MTAADLRYWQAQMGLTYDSASALLGVSRRCYANMILDTTKIDRRTALACTALAYDLGPYPFFERVMR